MNRAKAFFSSAALFLAGNVFAASPQILLVTAFNESDRIPHRYEKRGGLHSAIESQLRKNLSKSQVEITALTNPSPTQLYQTFKQSQYDAVFLAAHSTDNANGKPLILNQDGVDLTPIIQALHPRVRWLALVGCESEQFATDFKAKHPGVQVYSFKNKVDAIQGIKKATHAFETEFLPSWDGPFTPQHRTVLSTGTRVIVTRILDSSHQNYPDIRIENRGKILGTFPAISGVHQQQETILIPTPIQKLSDLKLRITTGRLPQDETFQEMDLGRFEIHATGKPLEWRPFINQKGEAIGLEEIIFRATGTFYQSEYKR